MKVAGKTTISKSKKTSPFISADVNRRLNLDARISKVSADVTLHVPNPVKPDSWYMTCKNQVIDDFVAFIDDKSSEYRARINISIQCQNNSLFFGAAGTLSNEQVFHGLVFVAGNEELLKMEAFEADLRDKGRELQLDILPSQFWIKKSCASNASGGGKIGFRYVLQDKKQNTYLSNDPMIIIPDWEPS